MSNVSIPLAFLSFLLLLLRLLLAEMNETCEIPFWIDLL